MDIQIPPVLYRTLSPPVPSGTAALLTVLGLSPGGWTGALLSAPTAWATPLALVVTVVVSLLTPRPRRWARTMARLHTPEGVVAGTP